MVFYFLFLFTCCFFCELAADHRRLFYPGEISISQSCVGSYNVTGDFLLKVSSDHILLTRVLNQNSIVLFENVQGKAFLGMEKIEYSIKEYSGMFIIDDGSVLEDLKDQSVESIQVDSFSKMSIKGFLGRKLEYTFTLEMNSWGNLLCEIAVKDSEFNILHFTGVLVEKESIHGGGVQNTFWNLRDQQVEIITSEHGVGRGKQPVTALVDEFYNHGGGNPTKSYAPIPLFFTNKQRGLFLKDSTICVVDFKNGAFDFALFGTSTAKFALYAVEDPFLHSLVKQHLKEIEALPTPVIPDWFHDGLILGIQGGTSRVEGIVNNLVQSGVRIAGVWMQDWSGARNVSHSDHQKRLIWNWDLNSELYPDWKGMVERFKAKNIRVLTYINAQLVNAENISGYSVNYWEEAIKRGLMIRREPYEDNIPYTFENVFNATIFDLSNPETWQFVKNMVKNMLVKYKSSGYMLDFGEYTPLDGCSYGKENSNLFHNNYPVLWQKVNMEVIRELGMEDEVVFFTRSAGSLSPNFTISMWAGDQLVEFDMYDGLRSSIITLLTSGLSGLPNIHSDTGGYTSFAIKDIIKIRRSKHLLWRWGEVNVFTQVFRSHEGMDPQDNHQIYDDEDTIAFFSYLTQLFACFFHYRKEMMQITHSSALPIHRHLQMDYPTDPEVSKLLGYEQFMFGTDFLIAPITDNLLLFKRVYLPQGNWIGLFNNKTYVGEKYYEFLGVEHGKPPVFFKETSQYGKGIQKCVQNIEFF